MAVPNSFALAAAQMGHDLVVAFPEGYDLDEQLVANIKQQAAGAGGSLETTDDIDDAFDGADVIYAKSWGAKQFYGAPEQDLALRAAVS